MPITLIMLAYAYPPENVSGAARPARFFRYLPEFGITPVIVTATPQPEPKDAIHYVPDAARDLRSTCSWQIERVIRKTLLPGESGLTWSRMAARACFDIATSGGSVAVLSTSPPLCVHLAARKVTRALRIPWISDFRDPMCRNSYRMINVLPFLESSFLANSDVVIANTDRAMKRLESDYPRARGKVRVIWNGFDPEDNVRAESIPARTHRNLVHIGGIYGGRHPRPILESILRLTKAGALENGRLRISLIGHCDTEELPDPALLRELERRELVEIEPSPVPQIEARRIACQADGLLLLQPQSDTQVPAKLFEYIQIGRPVLAYLKIRSPSEEILRMSGIRFRVIYTDDSAEQVDAKLVEFLGLPTDAVSPSPEFLEKFDARRQTKDLAEIVRSLVGRSKLEPESVAALF